MKKKQLLTDKITDLEDKLSAEMSRQLQQDIDWQVLSQLLREVGWTQITTSWDMMSLEESYELKTWCEANLKGHRHSRGKIWLFELEKDASMFALRWT